MRTILEDVENMELEDAKARVTGIAQALAEAKANEAKAKFYDVLTKLMAGRVDRVLSVIERRLERR